MKQGIIMNNEKWPFLVWIDLEMSGLDIQKDKILEIACIITDTNLNIIAEKDPIVIAQPQELIENMDRWNILHHTQSGLVNAMRTSTYSVGDAERDVLDFIKQHCDYQKSPLCGNSIWVDRLFLKMEMPLLEEYLYYRTVDVSTIKQLVNYWYGKPGEEIFKKENAHRALDDIKDSIEELRYYREHFFNKS